MKHIKIATVAAMLILMSLQGVAQTDNAFNATFEARSGGEVYGPSFDLGNIQPGDSGKWQITVETQNDSNVWVKLNKTEDRENGCTEPEIDDENTCKNDDNGELDQEMEFFAWEDRDGDFEKDLGEQEVEVVDQWVKIQNRGLPVIFEGGETHRIGVRWELPRTTDNIVQTDSVKYDLKLAYEAPPGSSGDLAPYAQFSYDPEEPTVGENVEFNASESNDDNAIQSYSWDFDGDGNYETTTSSAVVTHSFSSAGSYDVELEVEDNGGQIDTRVKTVEVSPESGDTQAPTAVFTKDPENPDDEDNVLFDASGSSDNIGIYSYEWDWDNDGNWDARGSTASNQFNQGQQTVTLRVNDTSNNPATTSQTFDVDDAGSGSGGEAQSQTIGTSSTSSGGSGGGVSRRGLIIFEVTDAEGNPLEDVTVSLDADNEQLEDTTDSSGEASLNPQASSDGTEYEFILEKEGYQTLTTDQTVTRQTTNRVSVTMQESDQTEEHLLTINVTDESDNPVNAANIDINNSIAEISTNSNGVASINLPENYYSFDVSKTSYQTVTEQLMLDENKKVNVELVTTSQSPSDPNEDSDGATSAPIGGFLAEPGIVGGGFFLIIILLLGVGAYRYYGGSNLLP